MNFVHRSKSFKQQTKSVTLGGISKARIRSIRSYETRE